MLKRLNSRWLRDLAYILFFGLFLIAVYYLTNYCCENFFTKANSANFLNQREGSASMINGNSNQSDALSSANKAISSDSTFNSFFDSFASGHLINASASTLFRDDSAAAVYFPPDYSYQPASAEIIGRYKNEFNQIYLNDFTKPLSIIDKRCLGQNCLEQRGKKLIYNGKEISLPREIKESEMVALSIGSLEKTWLVGITLKKGVDYQGRVFYFDGKKFTPYLFPGNQESIISPYIGLFGFGGNESDFLIIYGAYRGLAYRVQGGKNTDISRFFDFRVMAKGFRPEVIKANSEQAANWYIFSSSLEHPQLIKLWQNQAGEIIGEAVYQNIFSYSGETVSFRLINVSTKEFSLLARVKQGTIETWQIFTDRGFKNSNPGELIFNPILIDSEIIIEKIANSRLGSAESPCPEGKFSFSTDNSNWQELPQGDNLNKDFRTPVKDNFYLRVDFPAQANKFYSPFLAEVLFDFYYQK